MVDNEEAGTDVFQGWVLGRESVLVVIIAVSGEGRKVMREGEAPVKDDVGKEENLGLVRTRSTARTQATLTSTSGGEWEYKTSTKLTIGCGGSFRGRKSEQGGAEVRSRVGCKMNAKQRWRGSVKPKQRYVACKEGHLQGV